MKRIKRLIGETNNVILAAGAIAGAIVAVAGAVKLFSTPTPPAILAGIENVALETNVGLSEFEARDQTADLGIPGGRVPAPRGYRLAAYVAATGSTGPATGTDGTETTPTSTPETPPPAKPAHTTPTGTTPTPAPSRGGIHKGKPVKVTKTKHTHAGPGSSTRTSVHVYKRTRVTEGATSNSGATSEGSSGPVGVPFVKPPAPETAFKSEGKAQTLNGTGAASSEVDAILEGASGNAPSEGASGNAPSEGAAPPTGKRSPHETEASPETKSTTRIALSHHCGSSCAAGPMVDKILADSSSPAQAAKEVATLFTNSRGRYIDHELHPLGADVEYTLKLTGFVHNDAILEWTLWSQSANRALPHSWWQGVIVKQVKPARYEETISGTFWAPLPPKPGDYVFHLAVYDEQGNRRGSGRTPVFH
jgi:hypothetical protein